MTWLDVICHSDLFSFSKIKCSAVDPDPDSKGSLDLYPDPDSQSGSRRAKMTHKLRKQ
jgi:hypothetical protein